MVDVDSFDAIIRILFFEAYRDVEVAEIRFNPCNVLRYNLILFVFLNLREIEYLVAVFIKLARGITDSLNRFEIYLVFELSLLDPIVESISMSEKHLQLLVQVKYFLTRRASHMELLHLAIFDVICCILKH